MTYPYESGGKVEESYDRDDPDGDRLQLAPLGLVLHYGGHLLRAVCSLTLQMLDQLMTYYC